MASCSPTGPACDTHTCGPRLPAIADALYAIGGKWKLQIIVTLCESPQRFNGLQRIVKDISSKVLTDELKQLELNGFITRRIYPGPPVVVEYAVTEYSHTLQNVLEALFVWGTQHRHAVKDVIVPKPELMER